MLWSDWAFCIPTAVQAIAGTFSNKESLLRWINKLHMLAIKKSVLTQVTRPDVVDHSSSFRGFFHTAARVKKVLVVTREFSAFGGFDEWLNDWADTVVIHNHQSFLLAQTATSHGPTFYNMFIEHLAWNVDEAQIWKKPPKKLSFVRLDSVSETHRDMNCKRLKNWKDFRRVDKSRFGGLRNVRWSRSNYSFGTPMGITAWPFQKF